MKGRPKRFTISKIFMLSEFDSQLLKLLKKEMNLRSEGEVVRTAIRKLGGNLNGAPK